MFVGSFRLSSSGVSAQSVQYGGGAAPHCRSSCICCRPPLCVYVFVFVVAATGGGCRVGIDIHAYIVGNIYNIKITTQQNTTTAKTTQASK